jgi:DNA ligase D-like protein (predicted polymerase)
VTTRDGVELTNLDRPLFDGAGVDKAVLVDYLDTMADRILPALRDRPLSVIRARPGQPPFMQKNLPPYAPDWIERIQVRAEASRRTISYPLCHDRRTLLWLANQRAVELHPTLGVGPEQRVAVLVVDLDPPEGTPFGAVATAAALVHRTLDDVGLAAAVKTSGSKGVHVVVPVAEGVSPPDAAAATRALAARAARLDPALVTTEYLLADRQGRIYLDPTRSGGASLAVVYGPRARPGLPVSFPVAWADLDGVDPQDFTVRTVPGLLGDRDPWAELLPAPQQLPAVLVEEGHRIPVPRVAAMHEGKRRRAAARRADAADPGLP